MQDSNACCMCLDEIGFFTLNTKMKSLPLRELIEFSIGLKVNVPQKRFVLHVLTEILYIFQFEENDTLTVCNECVMNVNNFYSFKHKILTRHNQLNSETETQAEIFYLDNKERIEELGGASYTKTDNARIFTVAAGRKTNLVQAETSPEKRIKTKISLSSPSRLKSNKESNLECNNQRVSVQVNECLICPAVLSDILQLTEHIATHAVLKCKSCKRNFQRYSNLKRHFTDQHTKPKPFICNVCGLGFSFQINLQTHSAIHNK